jgi:DNA-binding response OmpR family regulator
MNNNDGAPTILIVDDEEDIRSVLSTRLERAGFRVSTAGTGMEALNHIRATAPDLMILDIMLPGIDGMAVCGMVKHDQRFSRIPVVMMTARSQPQVQRRSMKLGADAYINKPFKAEDLIETVRNLLKGTSSDSAPATGTVPETA